MIDLSSADTALLETLLPAPLLASLHLREPPAAAVAEACERLKSVLTTLIPFVPAPAVDLQLANPLPSGGRGLQMTGTVLLADLSGFTSLSSQLAAEGRRGDEAVSAIVRRLFSALIAEIEAHGGRLLKFSGHALTAFFDAARLGIDHAALAGSAALALQARMADFAAIETSKGIFRLRLRIAAHSGQIFAAEVGDRSHMEQVVTGAAINRVVSVLESASPGEVIVSDAMALLLGDAQTHRKLAGLYLLQGLASPPHPPTEQPIWRPGQSSPATLTALVRRIGPLRAYLPYGLPRRFTRTQPEDGEFRPITLLFANFYAFSKLLALLELPALVEQDMGIVGRILNTYYTRIQTIMQRYGGGINTFDMASFGDRLMALFGAPIAHEDDPERAVRAALEIRATLEETNRTIAQLLEQWTGAHPNQRSLLNVANVRLRQRIAIAGGIVFAGVVGTPQRHEYMVMGEVVQVAARALAAAADGDLLLTSMTHRATRHLVDVEPLAPLARLHAAKSVPVFRVLGERPPGDHLTGIPPRATPLIGRQAELSDLVELARSALTRGETAGRIVALIGEPGIGKSRLADETLRALSAALPTFALAWVECHSYEQTIPYVAITRILRQLLEVPAADQRAAQSTALARRLEDLVPGWSRFATLLEPLLNLSIAETALTQGLTPEQRRDRLHDMIAAICAAVARRRPLVLVFDDLQWADASSQALINRLATELAGQPVLLLLIYRTLPDLAEPWRALAHTRVLELGALAPHDSKALIGALLDGSPPAELLPLVERTQGTPLFLEETVRYMIGSGALRRDSTGGWECAVSIDTASVPSQIEQLITARLDRLNEETRALLQIASVIGQHFSEELLALVSQQPSALAPGLAELIGAALIVPDESVPAPTYRFKHTLIHDIAYTSMLFTRQQELHEHVAAVIEVMYGDDLDAYRVVLAQHYLRAGAIDRAFVYLLQAAQHAQARYGLTEALVLYRQALAVAPWRGYRDEPPHLEEAIILYENMGDVLALTGDYTSARQSYERLLELLKTSEPDVRAVRQAALQRKIGGTHENQGSLDMALSWFRRAAITIRSAPDTTDALLEHTRILSDIGWVYFMQRILDRAQEHLEQALARISSLDHYDEQAHILNRLGGVAYIRGDLALAQHYVEQSLDASARSGNLVAQASTLNNLGNLTGSQGRTADSIRYGLEALEINERIGNRRELAVTANNLGWAFYDQEEYQQAYTYFNQASQIASETRDTYVQMFALLNLGLSLTALQRWDRAEEAMQQSLFIACQLELNAQQLEIHVALAELALKQEKNDLAVHEYLQGAALASDTESEEYGKFQRLEARIAFLRGERERALELLKASEALFVRLHNVPEAGRTRKLIDELATPGIARPNQPDKVVK